MESQYGYQVPSNASALGQGYQDTGAALGPTLRSLSARFEELHKEADALLSLAGDLVGHDIQE